MSNSMHRTPVIRFSIYIFLASLARVCAVAAGAASGAGHGDGRLSEQLNTTGIGCHIAAWVFLASIVVNLYKSDLEKWRLFAVSTASVISILFDYLVLREML